MADSNNWTLWRYKKMKLQLLTITLIFSGFTAFGSQAPEPYNGKEEKITSEEIKIRGESRNMSSSSSSSSSSYEPFLSDSGQRSSATVINNALAHSTSTLDLSAALHILHGKNADGKQLPTVLQNTVYSYLPKKLTQQENIPLKESFNQIYTMAIKIDEKQKLIEYNLETNGEKNTIIFDVETQTIDHTLPIAYVDRFMLFQNSALQTNFLIYDDETEKIDIINHSTSTIEYSIHLPDINSKRLITVLCKKENELKLIISTGETIAIHNLVTKELEKIYEIPQCINFFEYERKICGVHRNGDSIAKTIFDDLNDYKIIGNTLWVDENESIVFASENKPKLMLVDFTDDTDNRGHEDIQIYDLMTLQCIFTQRFEANDVNDSLVHRMLIHQQLIHVQSMDSCFAATEPMKAYVFDILNNKIIELPNEIDANSSYKTKITNYSSVYDYETQETLKLSGKIIRNLDRDAIVTLDNKNLVFWKEGKEIYKEEALIRQASQKMKLDLWKLFSTASHKLFTAPFNKLTIAREDFNQSMERILEKAKKHDTLWHKILVIYQKIINSMPTKMNRSALPDDYTKAMKASNNLFEQLFALENALQNKAVITGNVKKEIQVAQESVTATTKTALELLAKIAVKKEIDDLQKTVSELQNRYIAPPNQEQSVSNSSSSSRSSTQTRKRKKPESNTNDAQEPPKKKQNTADNNMVASMTID